MKKMNEIPTPPLLEKRRDALTRSREPIYVGLIGCGTVGSGVVEMLTQHAERLEEKLGAPLILKRVVDRNPEKVMALGVKKECISSSWEDVIADPLISIVVELIGGVTEAKKILLSALKNGKQVVTANKALLATEGEEIFKLASEKDCDIAFEAAVGGGIPILRSLREGFAGNEIQSILAIINGTCNYILSEMSEKGGDFESTLQRAQSLGYAEQDPSFDIDGIDSAHKLSILISIAYGTLIKPQEIFTDGIRSITALDIACAKRFGFIIKLLAIAKKTKGGLEARVHPCMIPLSHPLASCRDAFNAIFIDGDYVGPSLLSGRGAGKRPTASAVIGDLLEIGRNLLRGVSRTVPPLGYAHSSSLRQKMKAIEDLESEYYLRFTAIDQPGILAKIAGVLGEHQISISSVYQEGQEAGRKVPIVILTHRAKEADVLKAIALIDQSPGVLEKTVLIRIERE